ncbi:MAG: hypothetical protein CVU49_02055 [Candidatus Cloacimonetes bacterium HGW-Cloacimonetes-2]|nr:MAG: hypothetical protein CVU49_02055 [Candidatus Cloacimonetes bacterium HGW-Cloacimonetes-2]
MRLALPLLILLLLLTACGVTEPEDNAQTEIRSILDDIAYAASFTKDINVIMQNVDNDYLHNGMNSWSLRNLWQDRLARYALLEISNIIFYINGDYARISMRMEFIDPEGGLILEEPLDSGDISYFAYNGQRWVICGKDRVPWARCAKYRS